VIFTLYVFGNKLESYPFKLSQITHSGTFLFGIKAELWTLKLLPRGLRKANGASHGHYDIDRVGNRT